MTIRYSTGARNFLAQHGSLKKMLQNGKLEIRTGSQPANADAAPTGTLLFAVTDNAGAHTAEVQASASFTVTGTTGGVSTLAVGGVSVIDAPVPFTTTLAQLAADIAAAINKNQSEAEYTAASSGSTVTVKAGRGQGAGANSRALSASYTGDIGGISGTLSGGVSPVNGLKFDVAADGVIPKDALQTWSGLAVVTGQAGWFRYIGSVADSGLADSSGTEIRVDGSIATSNSNMNAATTTVQAGATQTINNFAFTIPSFVA